MTGSITEELKTLFQQDRKVSIQDLDDEEIRRLHYCSRHKVNFISGTMSPADKDGTVHELESLKCGLDYFAERGMNHVILQPKYMGSRCNIYLHRELEQCFAVSRNGYKIKQVDLTVIYEGLLHKFKAYMESNQIAMLILDGELLPWKAIDDGLIQRQFKPIEKALETEFEFLRQNGFEQAWGQLVETYQASEFEKDQFHIPVVYENGEEQMPDWKTSEMYSFLSEDEFLILDLTESDSYEKAECYFSKLTIENHMEGVVIKPEIIESKAVPYMKVRNTDYLSIIYGYDYRFPHKYRKLMRQKNISQKLRASMNEHRLGSKMLSIPFHEIAPDNEFYKEAAANLLFEVAKEKEIDPRL